jgi:hypothetical protein
MALMSELMSAVRALRDEASTNPPVVNELSEAVKKLIAMQSAPRSIVRDAHGRAMGIKVGDEIHSIVRDERGRATGVQVEGPTPDVQGHEDGSVTVEVKEGRDDGIS